MDCWSTKVVTITATNVTQQAKPTLPHAMFAHAQTAKVGPQLSRQMVELLAKHNVLSKEMMKPGTMVVGM